MCRSPGAWQRLLKSSRVSEKESLREVVVVVVGSRWFGEEPDRAGVAGALAVVESRLEACENEQWGKACEGGVAGMPPTSTHPPTHPGCRRRGPGVECGSHAGATRAGQPAECA